jgi:hypothetical protein
MSEHKPSDNELASQAEGTVFDSPSWQTNSQSFIGSRFGVLVLLQHHLNGKYCVSSSPSDERHTTR